MKTSKIISLVILAGTAGISLSNITHMPKVQNKIVLAQQVNNNTKKVKDNTKVDNQTLTPKQVQKLKNKTIEVGGMKFTGLKAVKIAPNMEGEFIAMPGFNPNGFASSVNEELYNYELNPANDQAAMNEATQLHGGNPIDTCVCVTCC